MKTIIHYKKEQIMSKVKYICYVRLIQGMSEYFLTNKMSRVEYINNLEQYYNKIKDVR